MGISVIVPLYNKAPFLESMLRSMIGQIGSDDELLIVDDGSTDGSLAIASRFMAQGVRILNTPHNSGPGAARNLGAMNASGTHLLFFDADDLAHPDLLAALREAISLYPTEALWSYRIAHQARGEYMDMTPLPESRLLQIRRLPPHTFVESCLEGKPVCTASSTCISAGAFRQAGGFKPGLRFGEDPELWARLSANHPLIVIDLTLAFYREVSSGSSYGYRAIPGSVGPYVDTLFKLAEKGGKPYCRLAFSVIARNTVFSLASGCGRRHLRDQLDPLSQRLTLFRRFLLWVLSCIPGVIYNSLLTGRKALLRVRAR